MNKTEKIDAIAKAMRYTGDTPEKYMRANIYVYADGIAEETKDILIEIQRHSGVGFELSYEIMASACNIVDEVYSNADINQTDEELEEDAFDRTLGCASVYTGERLSWLSNWNQEEITDIMKEYSCDIAGACAIWYDSQVRDMVGELINWVNEE